MSADSWSNYWQGREGDTTGALTGVESDKELRAHWAGVLADCDRGRPFLDLACGAGTVLKQASELGFSDLSGLDYSAEATRVLSAQMPDVKTVTASAAETGLENGAYTTIVSQFGLEYAGAEAAFAEAERLLAAGGRIETVLHMAGGAIEAEVKGHALHCATILRSQFIEKAAAVFAGAYAGDRAKADGLMSEMMTARDQVSALVKPGVQSLAAHLLSGTAQLWERRAAYKLDDVTGWLNGMKGEIEAYKARMDSMMDAALDEAAVQSCAAQLEAQGLSVACAPLALSGKAAAWTLSGQKPA